MDIKKAVEIIKSGTAQLVPEDVLVKKMESGKPLKVKLGMDPTAPDLHLGHAVVLEKMRQLQDLGHEIIFLIGDFTARIGDPTGRSKTRPALSDQQIKSNAATYFEQVGTILDTSKITVVYNSQWQAKLTSADLIKICAKATVAQLIDREDFKNRMAKNEPVSLHEILYPVVQGYDSVELKADIELGGTDQTFNLLFGRHLQQQSGQEGQVIVTMPILEGLDGKQKMSKSLGNAIGLTENSTEVYGKLMSISDDLMWRYYELLLHYSSQDISTLQERVAASTAHPMALKKQMAREVVTRFWSEEDAQRAEQSFEALFQKKDYSKAQGVSLPSQTPNPVWIVELLKILGAVKTSSDAKRLIEGKAVLIDDQVIAEFKAEINWKRGMIIKAGKHKMYQLV